MKISFIVICFNGSDVIFNCLRSILTLPFSTEFEIIIVDDASTDDTAEVVNTLSSQYNNIVVFRNEENRGRAYSRNKGIQESKGEYICFVDADDFVFPLNIDEIFKCFSPVTDMIIPSRMDYSLDSRSFFSYSSQSFLFTGLNYLKRPSDFPVCFFDNFITGKFIRRDLLRQHNISFQTIRKNAEDILFATLLWLHSRNVRFVSSPFYIYGRGNYKGSFSVEKCEDVLINMKKILEYSGDDITTHETIILTNKYARIALDTMKRAEGVINEKILIDIFKKHYIDIRQHYSELIYISNVNKKFVQLCNDACYAEAYQLSISNISDVKWTKSIKEG